MHPSKEKPEGTLSPFERENSTDWSRFSRPSNSNHSNAIISAAARSSPLSRAQVAEVLTAIQVFYPLFEFEMIWVETRGDLDQKTSLRTLGKTDFFTRELDLLLFSDQVQIAIHSAKDLPDPLPKGLEIAILTRGVDPRDCLVLREGETVDALPSGSIIATSSQRREEAMKKIRSDLKFVDLRGTIGERLKILERREADGVIVAEAALIRLKLTHLNRIFLPGETALLQGQIAILTRCNETSIRSLFRSLQGLV